MSARGSAGYGRRRRGLGFTPGPTTLLALYPRAWRRRYGDELDALILDMHADGRPAGARMRADLLRSAARERLRGGEDPSRRVRGGASLVLWAWSLFAVAGGIVAKTSEHWQQVLPGASAAHVAFSVLKVVAFASAAGIAVGVALTLPAAWRLLREQGWRRIRVRALLALALTAGVIAGTVALAAWAHTLSPAGRDGHDGWYAAAFVAWGGLAAACLFAWASVAARLAADVRCARPVLRVHARLAPAVAVAMAAMTVATLTWWAVVAARAPGALTGGSTLAHPSPLVPALVLAGSLMVLACGVAAVGALRAERARAEL
ncbi:MAG TPA: hypothetical protein VKV21_16560 [Solirubrobacteraceae bacterium]|nr:hypothetical protein [Solirubrobacteraceae bacterium]